MSRTWGTVLVAAMVMAGGSVVLTSRPVHAGPVETCAEYNIQGVCLEWTVVNPSDPGNGGGDDGRERGLQGDGDTGGVACYWVNIPPITDPTLWVDFGLPDPPADERVQWQEWECSDGSTQFNFRWVLASEAGPVVTPEGLATTARGRLAAQMPEPVVSSSPPVGVAAIVGVPVFVEVANWTGTLSESECAAGLCVTVTATPEVTFDPGEAGSSVVACAGAGSRHVLGADPLVEAAAPGACTHMYRLRTGVEGRPVVWPGVVSVLWSVSWSASSGASGSLDSVVQSVEVSRAVEEVQTVVAGGETP